MAPTTTGPTPSSVGLSIEGVTVRFGDTAAVDDATLDVPAGTVLAVLGPSGCGKSTLLRAVAGLERLDSGRVSYAGADLRGIPTHRRGFAMMFQDGQLFAHADVGANVGYALRLKGIGRAQRVAEVDRLLTLVGLPATLSGGEQQRVALARALAARPRLLLLDEPLSALDRSLRERLALDLRQVLVETGTTALLVTHDHDEAFTVADRTAIMRAGRVVQVGPTIDVWRHPADADTARFLGYDVVLHGSAAALVLAAAGMPPSGTQRAGQPGDEKLDEKQADENRPGDGSSQVPSVALRRSAIRVAAEGPLEGVVRAVTPGREGLQVMLDIAGIGELPGIVDGGALGGPGVSVSPGALVAVRVDDRQMALLGTTAPPATG
jgi:thiamine transport system ATP-binding protein